MRKPEGEKDPQLAKTMPLVDMFFQKGGYELLAEFVNKYDCASLCSTPLFYLTKDVKMGPPQTDCISASLKAVSEQKGPSAVWLITGLLLLISVAGGFVLCSKSKEEDKDMMNKDDA